MKKITLFAAVAAVGILCFAACQKAQDTPAPQEEVQEEEPLVKSAAAMLNKAAEEPEVQEAVKQLLLDINKGTDWHHLALAVSGTDEKGDTVNYVSGEVGLIKGEKHLLEVDLNLVVMDVVPVVGTLDPLIIVPNLTKALIAKNDVDCDYYLLQANDGIKVSVFGFMSLALMRTEDEEGLRKIDLFLVAPFADPVPLSSVLALLLG